MTWYAKRGRMIGIAVCGILFVLGGTALILLAGAPDTRSTPLKETEWRLPAEVESLLIQDEYFKKWQNTKKELGDHPELLEKKLRQISEEERRLEQHVMDLHGFSEPVEFMGNFNDKELLEAAFAKYPELYRRHRIQGLKSIIEAGRLTVEKLEREKFEMAHVVREEFRQFVAELAKLELEEAEAQTQAKFPRPHDEAGTFFPLELDWWELKEGFLRKYVQLQVDASGYQRSRWELVQEYRAQLRDLMRSKEVQPIHYQEYQQRSSSSLEKYVQQHPDQQKQWQELEESLSKQVPGFVLEKTEGMAMVVGLAVECSVPPAMCRGGELRKGKPVSGMEIRITKTEGELTLQKVQGGAWMLLPPSYLLRSDAKGRFIFPALPSGEYTLTSEMFLPEGKYVYRGLVRSFYIESSKEILILDIPVERLGG